MWLQTCKISQPESQTRRDKLTIYNLASAWWKILIQYAQLISLDSARKQALFIYSRDRWASGNETGVSEVPLDIGWNKILW